MWLPCNNSLSCGLRVVVRQTDLPSVPQAPYFYLYLGPLLLPYLYCLCNAHCALTLENSWCPRHLTIVVLYCVCIQVHCRTNYNILSFFVCFILENSITDACSTTIQTSLERWKCLMFQTQFWCNVQCLKVTFGKIWIASRIALLQCFKDSLASKKKDSYRTGPWILHILGNKQQLY